MRLTACWTWASCPRPENDGSHAAERQTLFFSATIETSVKHLVETHVRNAVRIEVGSTTKPIEKVALHLYEVEQDRKLGLLERMLRQEQVIPGIARTKRGADRLSKKLAREGVRSAAIHGDRSQNQRNQALRGFQEDQYRVLVATDVAARGIHVEGISHVVSYDLPQVPEDFIHRVGRTWRAGERGAASTFAMRSERRTLRISSGNSKPGSNGARYRTIYPGSRRVRAPVIVIPSTSPKPQRRVRSFGPQRQTKQPRGAARLFVHSRHTGEPRTEAGITVDSTQKRCRACAFCDCACVLGRT
jgi:superfamily II DNA/RNA helicase